MNLIKSLNILIFLVIQLNCLGQSLINAYQTEVKFSKVTFVDYDNSNNVKNIEDKNLNFGILYNKQLNELKVKDYTHSNFAIYKNVSFSGFNKPFEHYISSDPQSGETNHIYINKGTFMFGYKDKYDGLLKKTIFISDANSNIDNYLSCFHDDISSNFDLQVFAYRAKQSDHYNETCYVTIHIIDKTTKVSFHTIEFSSDDLYGITFSGCDRISSLSKGFKIDGFGGDNFYGDIIIADFNFDGLDDIACANADYNSGQRYNFYIQNRLKKFVLDTFLTKEIMYFPKIDSINKTLTTYLRIGMSGWNEDIYKYNSLQQ